MRLIIFLFLVFFCFSACSVKQDALRVAGLYDKGTQLDVYLVARDGVNKDTLSKGEVLDGFFSLSAKMGSKHPVSVEICQKKTGRNMGSLELPRGEGSYLVYLNQDSRLNWQQEGDLLYEDMDSYYQNHLRLDTISRNLRNASAKTNKQTHDSLAKELVKEIESYMANEQNLMKRNAASYVSAMVLQGKLNYFISGGHVKHFSLQRSMDRDKYSLQEWEWLMSYYRYMLNDSLKNWLKERYFFVRLGKMSADMQVMQVNRMMDIGHLAPNFSMTDLNGNVFKMHDIKAKVKFLDFWSSWCGKCRADMPEVMQYYNEFRDQGFEVLAVSVDYIEKSWKEAIKMDKLDFKYHGLFNRSLLSYLYGVAALPATYLLDEHNNIIGKNLHGQELREAIRENLK
ncbi:TlpA family protein disulfide reductase [Butyricimonas sp. RTP31023st2_F12_RTP31023_210422]|uniref:TlpA family protein disulfide reductase n=1 Tax=Butyricimonas sp. RTP31023st2_F12_RTP31023_210422 TaxID=3143211 RepID=UPI0034A2A727